MTATRILTTVRTLSVFATATVFAAAVVLSYAGLRDLALNAGVAPHLALLLPLVVDGLIVSGSLLAIASLLTQHSPWFAWSLVVVGSAASLWGNVALAQTPQAMAVHALAPVALILSMEASLLGFKRSATARIADEQKAEAAAERAERAAERRAEKAAVQTAPQKPRQTVQAPRTRPQSATANTKVPIPPDVLKQALEMHEAGTSVRKIAEQFPVRGRTSWSAVLAEESAAQKAEPTPAETGIHAA